MAEGDTQPCTRLAGLQPHSLLQAWRAVNRPPLLWCTVIHCLAALSMSPACSAAPQVCALWRPRRLQRRLAAFLFVRGL